MNIVDALGPAANWKCFVVYQLVPQPGSWKSDKRPVDPLTGRVFDSKTGAHLNPANWITAHEAALWATSLGQGYGVGIVIYEGSGLFCIDLDDAVDAQGQWSPWAQQVVGRFPGAAMELSASGRGLHILGRYTGALESHSSKCSPLKTEAYTKARFIGLTGTYWQGDLQSDHTKALTNLLLEYFPPRPEATDAEWTSTPCAKWSGPADDSELINKAVRSHGAGVVFGGKAAFIDLWIANPDKLARTFPSSTGDDWDRSSADLAMANHLAFWTGNNCERMARLMKASGLARDKWEREDYFQGTILNACATQKEWYNDRQGRPNQPNPSAAQVPNAATGASGPAESTGIGVSPVILPTPSAVPQAVAQAPLTGTLVEINTQGIVGLPGVILPTVKTLGPGECPPPGTMVGTEEQQQMFHGCVYVEDINMAMMPDGTLLDSTRFDNRFPGVTFITTIDGCKPERSAWTAFVQSEVHAFPKVRGLYFAPLSPPGDVVWKEGMQYINSFVPVDIEAAPGDYAPFWNHLKKLLPNGRDAEILLYYMAAVVQNPGVKFQWWPFIQGVPGNGKSFVCEALERCVGSKFTHAADASKLGGRFNAAFYGKLFVRIDEVKIDHKHGNVWESLKLLITQDKLEIEAKGVDSVTREVCFNGMLLSNHKNGVRKTEEDRRICVFYCAQQLKTDLARDGLDMPYFNALWDWANAGGWETIRWLLLNTTIPDEYNPAKACRRAPDTTSTNEAIMEGWGVAEQEVLEAINTQQEGFKGGWVSSAALDRLLGRIGKDNTIPRRARGQLLSTMGYVLHPALPGGRMPVRMPDGSMPLLFLKAGHPALAETQPLQIVAAYTGAQK
jgi:hypothetical protein